METEMLAARYRDNVFAAAFSVCGNAADADDVVQETFLQYHTTGRQFDSEEHIRAWLLRVAINKAKNLTRSFWRRNMMPLEDYMETLAFETPESAGIFDEVMHLPEKYRVVLHLYYFEDYSIREIAEVLRLSEGNVKVRLSRGRALLKQRLKEEWNNDGS